MNFRTSYLAGLLASVLAVSVVSTAFDVSAAQQLKITGPDGQERVTASSKYGPTTPQDTFWSIAQKVRPDSSVSIYQVMAAIYEANPHAFSGPNYNALEKRMMLTIPSKSVMTSIPRKLAQQQAEEHDRAWRRGTISTKPIASRPAAKVETAVTPKPPKVVDKPASVAAPVKVAAPKADELAALQAEVTRLNEALGVKSNDVQALTTKVKELTDELQSTNEAMADLKLQNEQLLAENKELKQSQALAEVEASKPTDTWRSFMDNPFLLMVAAIIPASLILLVVWLVMRRRRHQQVATQDSATKTVAAAAATAAVTGAAMSAEADEIHEAAVQLDADDVTLDSLLKMDSIELQPEQLSDEQDLFVANDNIADDGQSLDDLWAEAMGEQAEPEPKAEDLDSMMAGLSVDNLEPDLKTKISSDKDNEDDLDALLAGFDATDKEDSSALETITPDVDTSDVLVNDDVDELMVSLATEDDSVSAELTKELEDVLRVNETAAKEVSDDELDAMLASFAIEPDETAAAEQAKESMANDALAADTLAPDDLADAIAAELESEVTGDADDTDLDALLASFDTPSESVEINPDFSTSNESLPFRADEELADAIAAELEASLAETNLAVEVSDDDLDALLAGFNTEDAQTDGSVLNKPLEFDAALAAEIDDVVLDGMQNNDQQTSALSADLDTTSSMAESDIDDLDALLASFNDEQSVTSDVNSAESVSDITSGLGTELPHRDDDDSLESLLAGFEPSKDSSHEFLETTISAVAATAAGVGALSFESTPNLPRDPVALSAKDSGFFNDLKANKTSNVLEWDPVKTEQGNGIDLGETDATPQVKEVFSKLSEPVTTEVRVTEPIISDEDLLAEFGNDDEFVLDVGQEHNMTVEQALAALDASEKSKRSSQTAFAGDLSRFQKENGFIDIDKLLNDADESEPEPYRALDMEIGPVESLIGNTPMVDVDDEENSVNAKLDLARAYIEIDDEDSARALLKEVELDGNDRQKSEAATLLKEIG